MAKGAETRWGTAHSTDECLDAHLLHVRAGVIQSDYIEIVQSKRSKRPAKSHGILLLYIYM